jgi:hypothetical protein
VTYDYIEDISSPKPFSTHYISFDHGSSVKNDDDVTTYRCTCNAVENKEYLNNSLWVTGIHCIIPDLARDADGIGVYCDLSTFSYEMNVDEYIWQQLF